MKKGYYKRILSLATAAALMVGASVSSVLAAQGTIVNKGIHTKYDMPANVEALITDVENGSEGNTFGPDEFLMEDEKGEYYNPVVRDQEKRKQLVNALKDAGVTMDEKGIKKYVAEQREQFVQQLNNAEELAKQKTVPVTIDTTGWETTGDEQDLAVQEVSVTNGTVTVVMTGDVTEAPVAADFAATLKIDAADATALTLADFVWAAETKTATFTFAKVEATTVDQKGVVAVAYKTAEAKNAEFTVAKVEGLKVESVSAIDKTIELNVAALEPAEGAKANVEIFKLNKDGEKTTPSTLKVTNLNIEEGIVTVDASVKTFGDADYAIVVKVGDVEEEVVATIEFDAVEKLVTKINGATAAQLATLLNNEDYFTGFDIAKVDAYFAAKELAKPMKTLAEVQEKVLDAGEVAAGFTAFVKEIDETKGVFAKYTLLKETFKFVDDANMDAYMDVSGPIFKAANEIDRTLVDSFEEVQDEIDQINLDAVVKTGANKIAFASIATSSPSELNAYKADLEALELVNATTKDTTSATKTKAEIIEAIDTALKAIDTAREAADKEIVKAQTAIDAFVVANGGVPTVAHTNYDNIVGEIENLQKDDLKASELAIGTLTGYITALKASTLDLTIHQDAKDAMSDFEAAYKALNGADYTSGNSVYDAVAGHVTTLDTTPTDSTALAALKNTEPTDHTKSVKGLEEETRQLVLVKDMILTTSASEMRSLLLQLTAKGADEVTRASYDKYVNMSSAAKTEFAQYVIDELAEKDAADKDTYAELTGLVFGDATADVKTSSNGYYKAYNDLISGVNNGGNIAGMVTALKALKLDAFDDLGVEAQMDIADAVLEHANYGSFKTIAEIVAAIDEVIAAQ